MILANRNLEHKSKVSFCFLFFGQTGVQKYTRAQRKSSQLNNSILNFYPRRWEELLSTTWRCARRHFAQRNSQM